MRNYKEFQLALKTVYINIVVLNASVNFYESDRKVCQVLFEGFRFSKRFNFFSNIFSYQNINNINVFRAGSGFLKQLNLILNCYKVYKSNNVCN